jgi:hypothetical protein
VWAGTDVEAGAGGEPSADVEAGAEEAVGPATSDERCGESALLQALSCNVAPRQTQAIIATTEFRLATMTNRRFTAPAGCI